MCRDKQELIESVGRKDVIYSLIYINFDIPADEPGKQVRSAIKIKNTSKSHVAFKVCRVAFSF